MKKQILFAALFCAAQTFGMDVVPVAKPRAKQLAATHAQPNVILPLKRLAAIACMENPGSWAKLKQMMNSQAEVAKLDKSGRPDVRLDESLFPDAHRADYTQMLYGHAGEVTCLACDPHDKKVLASGSADGTIRFWDITTKKCLRTIRTIPKHDCIAFNQSKQGELVSASGNNIIRWNTNTGHQIGDPIKAPWVERVISNPHDHRQWASGSLRTAFVYLWDLETREKHRFGNREDGKVSALDFDRGTPNRLIVASNGQTSAIRFWDTATGENTHEIIINHIRPDWHPVFSLKCIKPAQFVIGSMEDNFIEFWDTTRKERIRALNAIGTKHARQLAWNEINPTQIASTDCKNSIQVWDTETGDASLTIQELTGIHIRSLELCAGHQLAAGLNDHNIHLWKIVRLSPVAAALKAYMQTRNTFSADCEAEIRKGLEALAKNDGIKRWRDIFQSPAAATYRHGDTFPAHLEAELEALSYEERQCVLKEWAAKFYP